jgi:2-polyprenyl-6-methoxyphenol hydroxylase-like FAD-dependent oxidoreductase
MSERKVLIVGGGIAGMSLAIRLRELNWAVDLVELDPLWRIYGAGISITQPTFRAAKRLGIYEELCANSYTSHAGVRICMPDGRLISEMPVAPIEPGLPTAGGIMRPVLHEILSRRTRAAGAQVRLGVSVVSFTETPAGVQVETTDGQRGSYDLVVGADGAFSKMRKLVFPGAPEPKYTGQYCWRLVAERAPEVQGVHFFVAGPVTAGVMPTSQEQMYMFLLQAAPQKYRIEEATQWQLLRDLMAPFSGMLGKVREGLSANATIIGRPLEAVLLPRPWSRGRVLLIGDAVHATTPHLASGAGISIEDALVLSEELQGPGDIRAALQRYEARRWERCRLVVENSVQIGELEQTHADPKELQRLMAVSEAALREDI